MTNTRASKGLLILASLCLSACADDILPEVPTSSDGTSGGDDTTTTNTTPPTSATISASGTMTGATDTLPPDTDSDTVDPTTGDPPDTDTIDPTTGGTDCGNGALDPGEDCDGADLDGEDCISQGFDGGDLACDANCEFDAGACTMVSCGDNMIEGKEVCDGTELDGEDCITQNFDGGELACDGNCMAFDTSGCYECGDNGINPGETCDGTDVDGMDCTDFPPLDDGTLGCMADCSDFDTSACTDCGDDTTEGNETCDGTDIDMTCADLGFSGGTIGCMADCSDYDTSLCVNQVCDGVAIEGTEVCDGLLLDGEDCISQGFTGGTLACAADCLTFDTSACTLTVCSADLPLDIPDNDPAGVNSVIDVVPSLTLVDVDVQVDITHTWIGDLNATLQSPAGTIINLWDTVPDDIGNSCNGQNMLDVVVDDESGNNWECIEANDPAMTGDFASPNDLLATFDAEDTQGTWTLNVNDGVGSDTGTLDEFCLTFGPNGVVPPESEFLQNDNGNCDTTELGCSNPAGDGGNPNDLLECYTSTFPPPITVTDVQYFLGADDQPLPDAVDLVVHEWDGPGNLPGAQVGSEALGAGDIVAGQYDYTLLTPVQVTTAGFCVGFHGEDAADGFRVDFTDADGATGESYILAPTCLIDVFTEASDLPVDGNYCIRPTVSGVPAP